MQEIIAHIESGNFGYAVAMVLVFFLVNTRNIVTFRDEHRKRKLNILLDASKSDEVSEDLKKHFRDEIEVEYFRLTYGVKVRRPLIRAMLRVSRFGNENIPFGLILSARKYFDSDDEKCVRKLVSIDLFSSLESAFNLLASCLLALVIYSVSIEGSVKDIPLVVVAALQVLFGLYQLYGFLAALLLKIILKLRCGKSVESAS